MSKYYLNYLDELESEAIYILREVWAQFENPVILIFRRKRFYSSNPFSEEGFLSQ